MKKIVKVLLTVVLLSLPGLLSACAQNAGIQNATTGSAARSADTRTHVSATGNQGNVMQKDTLSHAHQATGVQGTPTRTGANTTSAQSKGQSSQATPLRSLRMMDASNGWALTGSAVLKTTDGGLHWHNVSPAAGLVNQMSSGAFHDMQRAWIATPPIYNSKIVPHGVVFVLRTVDGGAHWLVARFYDSQVVGIVGPPNFINVEQGWLEVGTGSAAGHESVDIFSSSDSGQSWRKGASTSYRPTSQLPFEGDKTGISFSNASDGWATGMTSATDLPWFYVTHDGGYDWQVQTLPLLPDVHNAFYETTPPVLLGSYGLLPVIAGDTTQRGTAFYATYDGGAHWVPRTLSLFVAQTVYIVDARHAWASDSGTVYETSDGGYSWVARSRLAAVTEFSFIDTLHGWAIESSDSHTNLYHTQDGGWTWHAVNYTIL